MRRGLKESTKNHIAIVVYVIFYLLLTAFLSASYRLKMNEYNGVVLACAFAICLLLIKRDRKVGAVVGNILLGMSLISNIMQMVRMQSIAPLPGTCNYIVYIVAFNVMVHQFRIRDMEAVTDFLTGLANRRGLYRFLHKEVDEDKPFHIIYVSLGNFRMINDNLGHVYGDKLLKNTSDRMKEVCKDQGTVARLGGFEFVVVLDGKYDAKEMAEKILDRICEKNSIAIDDANVDCYLTAFAGITSYPEDSQNYEDLIKYADIAMYHASKSKTERIGYFDKDMEQSLNRKIELEKLIKEGLEKDYFYMVYQPQYELHGKVLRGFESLLRMKTGAGVVISPGEFIPIAEKSDLILKIDDYVLRRAMNDFKGTVEKNSSLVISINVSAKNIGSLDFAEKIKEILAETGFPAKNLEIEITEYCMVQSVDITIANIEKLKELGVRVALDDFGTGYTSLSYLAKMPIDLLKVDKSLIDDIETDEKSREFVKGIVEMGHLMECEVISEGVEGEAQLEILKGHGCDFVQGYVWGKPLDYDTARELAV